MIKAIACVVLLLILILYMLHQPSRGNFGAWYDANGKCGLQDAYIFTRIDSMYMTTEYRRSVGSTTYPNTYSMNGPDTLIIYGDDWGFPWYIQFSGDTAVLTKRDSVVKLSRRPKLCM